MKKIITGLFAIAAFTFSAYAQENNADGVKKERHGYQKGHNGRGMKGMDELNLTDAQKQQMKSINEDFKNKMQALNKNDNIMVKDMKAQRKALMQERKDKISAILTPEQKIKAAQMRKQHKNKGDWKDKKKGDDWKEKRKMEEGKEKSKS
jgi:Spy/CpxP family protein refolding chaperone